MPGALGVAVRVIRCWTSLQAVGSCLIGLSLLLAGPARFATPSFQVVSAVPQYVWGSAFLVCGLLMLAAALGRRRCVLWASLPVAVMFGLFAGSIAVAAWQHPQVPFTGPTVYAGLMVLTTVSGFLGRWVYSVKAEIHRCLA